ncbi:glycoside hydrolase family 16 protein [Gelatoporia subvermispora B]|uniref:Glycoside hydrolase family 16 protein n=1 Tax=Ceriporiopsis subvermispora (strain B) TaxID=914234 RepID=M2RCC3_CERS8|nr:glycoside hydrolase family 16 protein [Gelatoporia subvermispora B]
MSKPPSTASSTASSELSAADRVPASSTGSKRNPPLEPPKPIFFLRQGASAEDVQRDPFLTPDASVPATPKSVASNPFSAPSSVISFSAEQTLGNTSIAHGHMPQPSSSSYSSEVQLSRPGSSRVSVQSALRHSSTDLQVKEVRTGMRNRVGQRTSMMSPPVLPRRATYFESPTDSRVSVVAARPVAKRARSTLLTGTIEKPWLSEKDVYGRLAYWITYGVAFLGVIGGALRCYFDWRNIQRLGNICLVMDDQFDTFDTDFTWFQEVDMSGYGNGEFEMTTNSPNNSFVKDGKLYIVPTLTSDVIGLDNVLKGPYTYNISGCTNTNISACGAVANETLGTVINPVMSARLTTQRSHSIRYGKVEVVAKIPRGDWLWPAIWMLPVNDTYGPWPQSGEIDIMEARGNPVNYTAQGIDYVRGSLNWGPLTFLNGVAKTFGWWNKRRQTFADGFHTYAVEWSPKFIRIYVDSRLEKMLDLSFNEPFFKRGDFPPVVANGSQFIVTPDPWANGTNATPFDQPFFLILDVAVGGTNGWFPDGVGGKPWLDASLTAMKDFAENQATWYSTWPQNIEDRAMIVDSVKMWQSC